MLFQKFDMYTLSREGSPSPSPPPPPFMSCFQTLPWLFYTSFLLLKNTIFLLLWLPLATLTSLPNWFTKSCSFLFLPSTLISHLSFCLWHKAKLHQVCLHHNNQSTVFSWWEEGETGGGSKERCHSPRGLWVLASYLQAEVKRRSNRQEGKWGGTLKTLNINMFLKTFP